MVAITEYSEPNHGIKGYSSPNRRIFALYFQVIIKPIMKSLLMFLSVGSVILALGCMGSKKAQSSDSAPLNPNGDTELAVLMRAMYDDGMEMRSSILNGEIPESHVDLANLYSMDAAEPHKVASAEYQAYAKVIELAYAALENGDEQQRITAYKSIIQTCASCHQAMCPGPLVRIEKMRLPEVSAGSR